VPAPSAPLASQVSSTASPETMVQILGCLAAGGAAGNLMAKWVQGGLWALGVLRAMDMSKALLRLGAARRQQRRHTLPTPLPPTTHRARHTRPPS
jgi:hypothetical protein